MLVRAESSVNDHLALRGHSKIFPVKKLQRSLFGAFVASICHSRIIKRLIQSRQFRSGIFCRIPEHRAGVLRFSPTTLWRHHSSPAFPAFEFHYSISGLRLVRLWPSN